MSHNSSRTKYRLIMSLLCLLSLLVSQVPISLAAEYKPGTYKTDATLYVPDFESAEFHETYIRDIVANTNEPLEKTLLTYLLNEIAKTVPDEYTALKDMMLLSPGYMQSRDTALIHLTGEVLELDPLSRFTLCQAITNTICAPGQVKSCLILADGQALSLDEAQSVPTGVFAPNEYADPLAAMSQLLLRHTESETTSLHYRTNTALFYPTSAGHGIICEVKALTYASDSPEEAVRTVLAALSDNDLFDVPELPPLNDFLSEPPRLEIIDDSENILILNFDEELSSVLSEYGILRSVLMASITMSLQGYFPWINGIRCEIGGEAILAIVPVGLFDGANEAISFDRGYMLWQDFAHFILTDIDLYFINDNNKLTETSRYIPSNWAADPQKLLEQLFSGPSYYDSVIDLKPVFDKSVSLDELLNELVAEDNKITIDFSNPFINETDDLDAEQNVVYSLVNTMTALQWCRRVTLSVNGNAPNGQLSYETPFMRSMDYR